MNWCRRYSFTRCNPGRVHTKQKQVVTLHLDVGPNIMLVRNRLNSTDDEPIFSHLPPSR